MRDGKPVTVRYVYKSSPADLAGMQAGDQIVALNGNPSMSAEDLRVRIANLEIGSEVTLTIRRADAILLEEIRGAGLYDEIWQALAVFLPVHSVGVMGDLRTYENVIALRCVTSSDAMTADFAHLSPELLGRVSNRIINEVKGINRVTLDISSKPPATIEWE